MVRSPGKGRAHLDEVVIAADAAADGTAQGAWIVVPERDAFVAGNVDRDHHEVRARVVDKAELRRIPVTGNDLDWNLGKVARKPDLVRQEGLETRGSV